MTEPDQASTQSPEEQAQLLGFTPAALRAWFRGVPGWRSFNGAYLVAWGARYLPNLAQTRWWLWVTSGRFSENSLSADCSTLHLGRCRACDSVEGCVAGSGKYSVGCAVTCQKANLTLEHTQLLQLAPLPEAADLTVFMGCMAAAQASHGTGRLIDSPRKRVYTCLPVYGATPTCACINLCPRTM